MSFLPRPKEVMALANDSDQFSRSVFVYPTMMGFPVVPEEAW